MSAHWLFYLLVFVSATLLVSGGWRYFAADRKQTKRVNRRLAVFEATADHRQALDILKRERGISLPETWDGLQSIQDWLVQTGLQVDSARFYITIAALATLMTTLAVLLGGLNPLSLIIGVATSVSFVIAYLSWARRRRIDEFGEQLPDVLDVIVRSLKAGHPLQASLSLVAREAADPAGSEFGMAFDEVIYGLDLPSAMRNLAKRVGDPDLAYVVTSISVQSQSGGNLAEILLRLSRMIRERGRVRQKVRALTSEGRMSAWILTGLPVALFAFLSWMTPSYYGDVWDDPKFRLAMYLSGLLLLIGNLIMRKMVNLKY